ncbi:MAG: TadE/TadG family type IV pilus assembly protein [Hyphomonadaceae bacterium]
MTPRMRLSKARGGNVMIEFALLAPVFFMLIMGLVEFVLFQYKSYALNHVVYEAARNLQTGEVQTSADMQAAFHEEVCAKAGAMIDCESIVFDVRAFDSLNEVTYPPVEFDEDGNPTNFVFEPGGPNKYSVVRAALHHQFITPFMDKLFRMGPDMPAIVNSFCIVKNEPWV